MRLLLGTHALLWWLSGHDALSTTARADETNDIFISAASTWEIATRHRIGKLPGGAAIMADLDGVIADQGFTGWPISLRHGQVAGVLPGPYRDAFDRMLIAQAMLDQMVPVSKEQPFDAYGVVRLW